MNCPKCGDPEVVIENLERGGMRVQCKRCGLYEIRDSEGRKLLTEVPSFTSGELLE